MTRQSLVSPAIAIANAAAIGTLVPIALHQLGLLDHLPDPPLSIFTSDTLTDSKMAHPLGVPDSVPGIANFSATLILAFLARSKPSVRRMLAAKILFDTTFAGFNVVRQVVSFRKLCSWCTGTALCTFVSCAAAAPLIRDELLSHGATGRSKTERYNAAEF